jgi:hypothetical protein
MIITLLELHYLVAFGPGKLVGDHVEEQVVASATRWRGGRLRYRDVATEVVGAPRNATA